MSHTITFNEAKLLLENKKDRGNGKRHKLQNNTYLIESGDHYAVRLHHTNVIEIYGDGTYSLNTGGWNTTTTKGRINAWGPARVHSASAAGTGHDSTLCVGHGSDPRTPAKVQKCRKCHGSGEITTAAYYGRYGYRDYPVYETKTDTVSYHIVNGKTYTDYMVTYHQPDEDGRFYRYSGEEVKPLMRDGEPVTGQPDRIAVAGQITVVPAPSYGTLRDPIYHAAHTDPCHNCNGTGRYDYGSKPNPVIFYDGVKVDDTGMVIDPAPSRVIESESDKVARLAREKRARAKLIRQERAAIRTSREIWLLRYRPVTTTSNSFVIVYKAVNDDLVSGYGTSYPIGQTVEAADYAATASCVGGLYFCRTPQASAGYQYGAATRYLACEVHARYIIPIQDKIKAQGCKVLYEVDLDGMPVDGSAPLDTPLTHGSPYALV